mmetsp:Transcript_25548/g.59485  ORF Transcript_25548/g.59485 Transcript_25548/m.59485 type:complete len:176 (-) Transcript_25548:138-665(-)|eukprot:CAMPEP_0178406892 /NCGR_PEP_ID=MMETSP0689_2-20121128/19144_1 /TAXON_ID=160604 /ORGANISM="Amphidinium massartii, Strain CS-259" /LENGTH=175 /DNA_ID=CAMNT_0020027943 /DNA_START=82 /DNA_END=609 /DNA_ORIENTATION=+
MFFCCCAQSPNDHKLVEVAQDSPLELQKVQSVSAQAPPPKEGDIVKESAGVTALEADAKTADAEGKDKPAQAAASKGDETDSYVVTLVKGTGKKLGMVIGHSATHNIVKVQTVKDASVAADWNIDNPTKKVEEGCYILEINSEKTASMTVQQIGERLEKSSEVVLLLTKNPPVNR